MKLKHASFLITFISIFVLTSCQRPIIHHGSVVNLKGTLSLRGEDVSKGELCANFQTKEYDSDDAGKSKIKNHSHCFNVTIANGEFNVRRMVSFDSRYKDLEVLNVSDITFKVRTQVENADYDAFNIYRGQVEDFENPNKNLEVELSFKFEKTIIMSKLSGIVKGCKSVWSINVDDCVRWRIDPVSAHACAQATHNSDEEYNCLREVAYAQGTYR